MQRVEAAVAVVASVASGAAASVALAAACGNPHLTHSITSSARASSVGGTGRPSALAVVRLNDEIKLGRLLDRHVGWLRHP